jgi:exosortase
MMLSGDFGRPCPIVWLSRPEDCEKVALQYPKMYLYSQVDVPLSYLMPDFATLTPVGALASNASLETEAAFGQVSKTSARLIPRKVWYALALIGALLVAIYVKVAIKLVHDWIEIPDTSAGLLIPFFVGFLLWDQRDRLRATPLRPSWWGISLVACGLLLVLVGIFGADLFLSRVSFIVLISGLVWTLLGMRMLRTCTFMLFVLFLSIPLPTLILNHITFPLQLLASQVSSSVLPVLGVPVLRDGNVIQLPAMPLEVAEACSGIRSLMSLFTVAVIFGYFVERGIVRRTLLALASVPIAVAANSARIVGTGLCVQYWDPEKALGFFHEFSGWLMFLISMSCLYLVHQLLKRVVPERRTT